MEESTFSTSVTSFPWLESLFAAATSTTDRRNIAKITVLKIDEKKKLHEVG